MYQRKKKTLGPRQAKKYLRTCTQCPESDHCAHAQSIIRPINRMSVNDAHNKYRFEVGISYRPMWGLDALRTFPITKTRQFKYIENFTSKN